MRRLLIMLWRTSRADLKFLWFAVQHPLRPRWLRPAALALALYALSPLNFAMPLIGIVDDMILVPLLLHWMLQRLPHQLHAVFNNDSVAQSVAPSRFRDSP